MEINDRPKYLYRGISIDYEKFIKAQLYGIELTPPHKPLIDSQGRKTVEDGNEYGLYMTDNIKVADNAYSNKHSGRNVREGGLAISGYGGANYYIDYPNIGVVYEIDTDGLDIRHPWITSNLQGHYNNGYAGDEWIADKVPPENYRIIKLKISKDILHNGMEIAVSNQEEAIEYIKKVAEERNKHLEDFAEEIEKIPKNERRFDESDIEIYRDLFGEKGIKYTNYNQINLNSAQDYIMYLLHDAYSKNSRQIDKTTMRFIEEIKRNILASDSPDKIASIITKKINDNNTAKDNFIQRKGNQIVNTSSFDKKNQMMNRLLLALNQKLQLDFQKKKKTVESFFGVSDIDRFIKMFNQDGKGITYYDKSEQQLEQEKQNLLDKLMLSSAMPDKKEEIKQDIETIYNRFISDLKKTKKPTFPPTSTLPNETPNFEEKYPYGKIGEKESQEHIIENNSNLEQSSKEPIKRPHIRKEIIEQFYEKEKNISQNKNITMDSLLEEMQRLEMERLAKERKKQLEEEIDMSMGM